MRKIIKLALAGLASLHLLLPRVFARGVTDWLSEKQHQFGAGEKLPNAGKHYPQTKSHGWSSRLARRCWRH